VSKRDYYELLGVSRGASADEIKKGYRQQALQYHPDRNPGDKSAEDRFKEVNEAYSVLSDAQKREQYDRFGHAGPAGQGFGGFQDFGGFGVEDILNDFFGSVFGGAAGGGRRPQRGADLRYNLTIKFEEAVFGAEKEIVIPRTATCGDCKGSGAKKGTSPEKCAACNGRGQVTVQQGFFQISRPCGRCGGTGQVVKERCPSCAGTGGIRENRPLKVKIPAGVDNGTRMKLRGEGEAGPLGGPSGDLYVVISVEEHPFFVRDGADLLCEVPITFPQAALGGDIEVPTLAGRKTLTIPPGTNSGQEFVMKGEGVAQVNGYRRGNLVIRTLIDVPKKLTKRQKELLTEFQVLAGESPGPMSKSFFEKVKGFFE
jgi:molecular chaperone DnaJ